QEKCEQYIEVQTSEIERCVTVIEQKLGTSKYQVQPNGVIRIFESDLLVSDVNTILCQLEIPVNRIVRQEISLEQYFISLIGGNDNE
ncbi:MAG: hypothetical protein ACRCWQ_02860, partial [Bacilli bacterium]